MRMIGVRVKRGGNTGECRALSRDIPHKKMYIKKKSAAAD